MNTPYICDPDKNVYCPKTHCHRNGGECYETYHKEFKKENKEHHEDKSN